MCFLGGNKVYVLLLAVFQVLVLGAPINETKVKLTTSAITNCPKIVSRDEWKARKVTGHVSLVISPTPYVVIHHGGVPHYCYDKQTCSRIMRGYQDLHMDVNGWMDIGYQFVIGEDGNVYEGRGWDVVGAHAPGFNGHSIGVSIIGDFTDYLPNNESLNALRSLIECGISLGKISSDYKLIGHRQARNTECPGETLYQYIKDSPRWSTDLDPIFLDSSVKRTFLLNKKIDNITGSNIWPNLIALGEPRRVSKPNDNEVPAGKENVVDLKNTDDEKSSIV